MDFLQGDSKTDSLLRASFNIGDFIFGAMGPPVILRCADLRHTSTSLDKLREINCFYILIKIKLKDEDFLRIKAVSFAKAG